VKNTSEQIELAVLSIPAGQPFFASGLRRLGSQTSINLVLDRLLGAGRASKLAAGLYVRPLRDAESGAIVMPTPIQIIHALQQAEGCAVAQHGAVWARRFGLAEDDPGTGVYWTSGRARTLTIGESTLSFKHAPNSVLASRDRPAGQALAALWHLGASRVTAATFHTLRQQLDDEEFRSLHQLVQPMPRWMPSAMNRFLLGKP
jgi:uncharacterized protein DUF6088